MICANGTQQNDDLLFLGTALDIPATAELCPDNGSLTSCHPFLATFECFCILFVAPRELQQFYPVSFSGSPEGASQC